MLWVALEVPLAREENVAENTDVEDPLRKYISLKEI